jgi:hypothetical protein
MGTYDELMQQQGVFYDLVHRQRTAQVMALEEIGGVR